MSPRIMLRRVGSIPDGASVCHYDELDEKAKEQFPMLAKQEHATVDAETHRGFGGCEFVKFTDYYCIS